MNLETAAQTSHLGAKLQLGEVEAEVEPKEGIVARGEGFPQSQRKFPRKGPRGNSAASQRQTEQM